MGLEERVAALEADNSALKVEVLNLKENNKEVKDTLIRIDTKLDKSKTQNLYLLAGIVASLFVNLFK